jgi:hypothetical protein
VFFIGTLALARPQATLDRVVAALDGAAITQSDVEQEYKLESFLETGRVSDTAPPHDATFERVLDRLIDQRLLARELLAEGLESLDVERAVTRRFEDIRKKVPSDQAFHFALRSLDMDKDQLHSKLQEQERIVQMIDRRLRPDAKPTDSEIEAYYRTTFMPEFSKHGGGSPPPLAEVESQITEILVQKRIGDLMDSWIKQLRSTHRIRVLSGSR